MPRGSLHLTHVDVRHNSLTAVGISALVKALRSVKGLESVTILPNAGVHDAAVVEAAMRLEQEVSGLCVCSSLSLLSLSISHSLSLSLSHSLSLSVYVCVCLCVCVCVCVSGGGACVSLCASVYYCVRALRFTEYFTYASHIESRARARTDTCKLAVAVHGSLCSHALNLGSGTRQALVRGTFEDPRIGCEKRSICAYIFEFIVLSTCVNAVKYPLHHADV